jgi:predicted amidohydrolase YtcJ
MKGIGNMPDYPSYIFINGSVVTVDAQNRVLEAVSVTGGKVGAVGSTAEITRLKGPQTEIIELAGRSVLPGFIDAHCHPGSYAAAQLQIPCGTAAIQSIDDLKRAVKKRAAATPSGNWIVGRGYIDTELAEKRHPTRWDLDEAAPEHKVFIGRTCGHIAAVNSRTLNEFGVSADMPDPEGGKIQRSETGDPTGVLFEQAMFRIKNHITFGEEELKQGMQTMNRDFLAVGVTSATDASGRKPEEIRLYQQGIREGWLKVRMRIMVQYSPPGITLGGVYLETGLITGFGNEHISIGPWKTMLDGAGGGRSAAMRQAYPSEPDNFGILYYEKIRLEEMIRKAHTAGFQIAVHAIGDRAVEMTLDAYETVLKELPKNDHRYRIEHCGFLDDKLLDRMRDLKVIPALGLPFLYELGDNYIDVFGHERLTCVYPLKSLLDRGIPAALTSDAPVIQPNPLHGLYFAVTHKTKKGQSLALHESVGILDAIRAYTYHGAYANFEERIKGSIEPGKVADLVILSGDILKTHPEELLGLAVDLTMIDGEVVHQRV